ncbi:hypothetical protein [Prosthecobacter sp.]|jgi:hypothetical protein|uniref:hypothetical protein n=1 Tax=Prosthecobacter sp. TaxID=1965333 RepID=UPI003784D742
MPDLFSPYDPKDQEEVMEKPGPAHNADKTAAAPAKDDLPLHRDTTVQAPNVRRSQLTRRHVFISLAASIIAGLVALYAAKNYVDQKISLMASNSVPASAPASIEGGAEKAAAEQIAALQKQVDVMRREQLLLQQNTRESLQGISEALKNPKLVPQAAPATAEQPGVPRIADMKPDISPTQEEFILLKERNRLAQYADEAIATGMRKPLEVLIEYMRDPDARHLHEAAKAEYMRAVRSVQFIQREDPGYRLPVAELFKNQNIRDEADVKPEALLKLLADQQQPWEVRLRVCFLLLGSELPETNAKLIQAIKEDPSLDVAKHAQLALEQRIKRRFRIFDIPAIEAWAESQKK